MRAMIASLCVCLLATVAHCQNVKRPEVPARDVSDGEMQVIIGTFVDTYGVDSK